MRESKAVYKVAGFWQAQQQRAAAAADASGAAGTPAAAAVGTVALHAMVGFLQALTTADADGRIIVQRPSADASPSGSESGGTLRFVLLNAAARFGRVVSAAHAVILASGTLSPLESLLHLFPGVPPSRLHRFSCGHVVGRER